MKKIAIIGSSGLIGSALTTHLKQFYKIIEIPGKILYEIPEKISREISGCQVIINLAGHNVAGRWTKRKKNKIKYSRFITTQNLVSSFHLLTSKPEFYINASGISIYEDGKLMDENDIEFADNFLAGVVRQWEINAFEANNLGINTAVIRMGIILSGKGGAYPELRRLVKLFFVRAIGSGNQGMSVIHIDDAVRAINFMIEKKIGGIINLCLPKPTSNSEFLNAIALTHKTPVFFRIPVSVLKFFLLEGHIILTKGQKIYPGVLLMNGFSFSLPDIYKCILKLEE